MNTPGMWQQVGFLADIFGVFQRRGLSVDLVSTSEMNVTVSLDPSANSLDGLEGLVEALAPHCQARLIDKCAAVSLVGRRIRAILHKLGPALEVFEEQHIHLVSQAASDLNLTFVVDEEQADRLVARLHALLFDHLEPGDQLGPTWRETFSPATRGLEGAGCWWQTRREELLSIADEHGPVYVYDLPTVRAAAQRLTSMRHISQVFYAVKANPNEGVLRALEEESVGFECVSPGELTHVRASCGALEQGRTLFTPNFAPKSEYQFGFEHGAMVTLDNIHPLREWPAIFAGRDILVRVDPGHGRGHHQHVRTAGARSKFGIGVEDLEELATLADAVGARVVGLHAHAGSGILSPGAWATTGVFLADLVGRFPEVRSLDLGGGLGVPARSGGEGLDVAAMDEALGHVRYAHPHLDLWIEPGRYLVANAGVLLARVTQIKHKGDILYVGVETGMNSLIRPALYGAWHEIVNLTRLDEVPSEVGTVVGPICESGDTLGRSRRLPPTREGDVLLIATAGAYGYAMSSRYNLREPAGEFLLD
jgi:diaminopimelate decarboxylase/aspartate kinase